MALMLCSFDIVLFGAIILCQPLTCLERTVIHDCDLAVNQHIYSQVVCCTIKSMKKIYRIVIITIDL